MSIDTCFACGCVHRLPDESCFAPHKYPNKFGPPPRDLNEPSQVFTTPIHPPGAECILCHRSHSTPNDPACQRHQEDQRAWDAMVARRHSPPAARHQVSPPYGSLSWTFK